MEEIEIYFETYTQIRLKHDLMQFYDISQGKIGRHRFSNRLTPMNGLLKCLNMDLTDNANRIMLKDYLNFNYNDKDLFNH